MEHSIIIILITIIVLFSVWHKFERSIVNYMYSRRQNGCNIFFWWISEYSLFTEWLVLLMNSTIYNMFNRSTEFRNSSKKKCNHSVYDCTSKGLPLLCSHIEL